MTQPHNTSVFPKRRWLILIKELIAEGAASPSPEAEAEAEAEGTELDPHRQPAAKPRLRMLQPYSMAPKGSPIATRLARPTGPNYTTLNPAQKAIEVRTPPSPAPPHRTACGQKPR